MPIHLCVAAFPGTHRSGEATVFIHLEAAVGLAKSTREGNVLKAGDKAPAATGTAFDQKQFDLGVPGKRTVLFFYPKANTPG
jgi:hypothetical protein